MIVRVVVEIDGVREEEMREMVAGSELKTMQEVDDLGNRAALRVWERRKRLGGEGTGERKREYKWLPWRWRRAP